MILRWFTNRSGWTCKKPTLSSRLNKVGVLFIDGDSCVDIIGFQVKKSVTISPSALEAAKNADAIVIATEWKEFKELDWVEIYKHVNKPAFVFDGRLLVDIEALTKIGFKVSLLLRHIPPGAHTDDRRKVTTIGRPPALI